MATGKHLGDIKTINELPYTQNNIRIETSNKIYCHACIRHILPKLTNKNYLPEIVLNKIETHSYKGCVNYANNYIWYNYNVECVVPNCYICKTIWERLTQCILLHSNYPIIHISLWIKSAILRYSSIKYPIFCISWFFCFNLICT